jgi:glycine oxidase
MARPSDIIVVGAGIVGCAVAHELVSRGASVEIIDERPVGMGATQASAGVLAPYIEASDGSPLLDLTVRSLALFDEFVSRVTEESGVVVSYRRTGTLDAAFSEAELHELQATAAALARLDVPVSLLDGKAAHDQEPQLGAGALGALLIEAHGFVGASDLTRALAVAARRKGAQLLEGSRVRNITGGIGDIVVETNRGSLTSNAVVLCAGSWSGGIVVHGVKVPIPVRPVRGQLLHLEWPGTQLRRVTWSRRCYLVPWDDGTMLVGATVEEAGFDERTTVDGVHGLLDAVCAVIPAAQNAGFLGARVGLRPATTDDLPVIGASTVVPNLMYATGHYRNGVLLAPLTAKLVADAMLDNQVDPQLAVVSPSRFGEL